VVRRIVDETFLPVPHGLPGNDDLGATSSWLVWGSLGLFPMVPGVSGLAVASPAFPRIVVHMGNQKKLTIEAPAAPARYVWRLTIDGRPYDRAWLDESLVTDGGKLRFTLSEEPSLWGSGADTVPESFLGADR
jgi:putative alpha-1,2-mannosidase